MIVITILTYILNLFDLWFTMIYVEKYGIESEANPFARKVIQNKMVYVIKFFVVALILTLLYIFSTTGKVFAFVGVIILFVVFFTLFIYHLVIIFLIYKAYENTMTFGKFILFFFFNKDMKKTKRGNRNIENKTDNQDIEK